MCLVGVHVHVRGRGSNTRWEGARIEIVLLQNRDNSELLGTPVHYSLKLGGSPLPCGAPFACEFLHAFIRVVK